MQSLALAAAIFWDMGAPPVLPRWVGYYNVWVAIGIVPGCMSVFFRTGPFAWNGLFPFWIPVCVFASLFIVMFATLASAINRQEQECR